MSTQYSGTSLPDLLAEVDNTLAIYGNLDMRELSPAAPHYPSPEDRCEEQSMARRELRCILKKGHFRLGFGYCQFDSSDKGELILCTAEITVGYDGQDSYPCHGKVIPGTEFCEGHKAE